MNESSIKYIIKFRARVGPELPERQDDKFGRILNRPVTWTEDRIEYAPGKRRTDMLVAKMGLQEGSRSTDAPGAQRSGGETDEEPLGQRKGVGTEHLWPEQAIWPRTGRT